MAEEAVNGMRFAAENARVDVQHTPYNTAHRVALGMGVDGDDGRGRPYALFVATDRQRMPDGVLPVSTPDTNNDASGPALIAGGDPLPPRDPPGALRFVCVSDTHGAHRELMIPPGDVFIHAGDIFKKSVDSAPESWPGMIEDFNDWLGSLPHRFKLVIGGNHDFILEVLGVAEAKRQLSNCMYCVNETVLVDGLRVFLTPWSTSTGSRNQAFQPAYGKLPPGALDFIPPCDVLVTHDSTLCAELMAKLRTGVASLLHVGGHDHEEYGARAVPIGADNSILTVVACNVDEGYRLMNPAVVVDVDPSIATK